MHTRLTSMIVAFAASATTALAMTGATTAAGSRVGSGQGAPIVMGPAEVVDSYAAPYAGSWYWPTAAVSDTSGVVTAAWVDRGVQVAQRAPGGTWGTPTRLLSCTEPCDNGAARLAVDGAGTVTAVWEATTPSAGVYLSAHPSGGTWSTPMLVSSGDRRAGGEIDVAAARNGAVLLAYTSFLPGKGWDVVAKYLPAGGRWDHAAKRVFLHAATPKVGVAANGTSVLGVTRSYNASALRTYRFRPGHGWSRPVAHGASFAEGWGLAVDEAGRAVLSWRSPVEGPQALRARTMDRRGHWSALHVLTRKAVGSGPYVTVRRTATVLWSTYRGALRSATRTPGQAWRVTTAYPRHSGALRDVAVNERGDLAVLWEHWVDPMPQLVAGLRPAGGGWTTAVQVPARYVGENVSATGISAVLPDGSAVAVTSDNDADPNNWQMMPATLRILARHVSPAG